MRTILYGCSEQAWFPLLLALNGTGCYPLAARSDHSGRVCQPQCINVSVRTLLAIEWVDL